MGDLLQASDAIKTSINNIRNNVKSLEAQYKQALFAITPDQANKSSQEIQRLTDATNAMIQQVRGQIDDIKRPIGAAPDSQMRSNMADSLTQRFVEVVQQYQKSQTEYRDKVKQRMTQKFKIVKPDATSEEIDQAIESGQADKLFAMSTLDQNLHSQAKNALSYINDRHRDIMMIESSIRELHQLFVDMAVLVESGGAILDQVEVNVNSAVSDTAAGTRLMGQAIQEQKKSRKKMYILLLVLIIIIVVVLASSIGAAMKVKTSA
jgi:syntaxin 1B/2/3